MNRVAALSALAALSIVGFAPTANADTASQAVTIYPQGSGTISVWGDTGGASASNSGSCARSSKSRERVYTFTLDRTATVTLDTVGSSYDTVLHLRNSGWGEIGCDDDGAGDKKSRIVRTLQPGTYYVAVDGYDYDCGFLWLSTCGNNGAFRLNVTTKVVRGVAFVHGTGAPADALADYWKPEIVNTVAGCLPDPSKRVVVTADFNQYMWADSAAGSTARQLKAFIDANNIGELVVITHSNGGNVLRWILSNPTASPDFAYVASKITKVEALAPSSGGTPLADAVMNGTVLEEAMGWVAGFANDAVRMQQISWMANYNANNLYGTIDRPALSVPFRATVGTDVESSPFDGDSYCGGYFEQAGLELIQNGWLDACSDGFLNCTSQRAAGTYVNDKSFTAGGEPLSHNQSRRECFGLGNYLCGSVR